MNGVSFPAKFKTAEECTAHLRERATQAAAILLRLHAEAKPEPRNIKRQSERLDDWCTAIEVLTENGNYQPERSDAIRRAKHAGAADTGNACMCGTPIEADQTSCGECVCSSRIGICAQCREDITSMRGVKTARDGALFHGRCWKNV